MFRISIVTFILPFFLTFCGPFSFSGKIDTEEEKATVEATGSVESGQIVEDGGFETPAIEDSSQELTAEEERIIQQSQSEEDSDAGVLTSTDQFSEVDFITSDENNDEGEQSTTNDQPAQVGGEELGQESTTEPIPVERAVSRESPARPGGESSKDPTSQKDPSPTPAPKNNKCNASNSAIKYKLKCNGSMCGDIKKEIYSFFKELDGKIQGPPQQCYALAIAKSPRNNKQLFYLGIEFKDIIAKAFESVFQYDDTHSIYITVGSSDKSDKNSELTNLYEKSCDVKPSGATECIKKIIDEPTKDYYSFNSVEKTIKVTVEFKMKNTNKPARPSRPTRPERQERQERPSLSERP